MKCITCKESRKKKDFVNKTKECYKCVYKEKMKKIRSKKGRNYCRICENACLGNRWVYCSNECADVGQAKQKKEYWTMNVKSI